MSGYPRITLIHTGNELLLGLRTNHHLSYIGQALTRHGLKVQHALIVRDDVLAIQQSIQEALTYSDVVITTGGLGPTSDDVTKEAVAKALHQPLVYDKAIEKSIQNQLQMKQEPLGPLEKKQCYRPADFEALPNIIGTAPGLFYQKDKQLIFLLPGPTHELHALFETAVVPRIRKAFFIETLSAVIAFKTMGIYESELAQLLMPVFSQYADLNVAYCPHLDEIEVRLSSKDHILNIQDLEGVAEDCKNLLKDDYLGMGNMTLPEKVLQLLDNQNAMLSLAESCTGGLLAHQLTQVSGASRAFAGGVVCYQSDMKVELLNIPESLILQHGVVSAEVAVAMAAGVAEAFGTDYALSTTGIAGPTGGTAAVPTGTIYIGYYAPNGIWSRKLYLPQGRMIAQERTCLAALDWIRREMLHM